MRTKNYPRSQVATAIKSRYGEGRATLRPAVAHETAHGSCLDPVFVTERGAKRYSLKESGEALFFDHTYRCRKCENCLKFRSRQWAARACVETAMAKRTWLVTLTLAPESHWRLGLATASRLTKSAVSEASLSSHDLFKERLVEIGKEVTLWLKRTRERAGPFRYLLVVEAHKSGLPHMHLLVHEVDDPVTYRDLTEHWRLGFSHAKLVQDTRGVRYVCKYLSKSALARVRASARYGTVSITP